MECPRREESALSKNYPPPDSWKGGCCSYCGSLHPDELMRLVEAGEELTPTDKNYKAYIRGAGSPSGKFYFQHLSSEQQQKLIELVNDGTINFGEPGRFYVRPYFMAPVT